MIYFLNNHLATQEVDYSVWFAVLFLSMYVCCVVSNLLLRVCLGEPADARAGLPVVSSTAQHVIAL